MLQNFDVQGGPEFGRKHLPLLRAGLKADQLDGFLVPHEDEYNNEYLPDCNERLMWVSGFTGSAGAAVVLADKAAIFVDGRYTLQVRDQVDSTLFEFHKLEDGGLANWLKDNSKGLKIGYDPKLHAPDALAKLQQAVTAGSGTLVAVAPNPVDTAWTDRPAPPDAKLTIQPFELTGLSAEDKRWQIADGLKAKGADAAVITAPASIAWLLNIRGGDVMCSPLPLSSLILKSDASAELYINPDKVTPEVKTHLGNAVSIEPEERFSDGLKALKDLNVLADPGLSSAFVFNTLKDADAHIIRAQDPIALPKACKTKAEIKGTVEAHIRDGAALTRFLHWLDTEAQDGSVDEIEAAVKLEGFRIATGKLKDLSFESISGAGPDGAIVHYRVSTATNRKLKPGELYLIDSGGQYLDGTTDVTRTVPIGKPDLEMKTAFTLVLKGHIALARVRFPEGTSGHALDALARTALWAHGFDYDHGTGHGVGAYLGVHEGPQRIAKWPNTVALRPGMIVSNEPGYYKTGAFGIRIENLQYVTEPGEIEGGERKMLGFETLTLAPIHRDLIVRDLLTEAEIAWVNAYHARVLKTIGPLVDDKVTKWLIEACNTL